MTLGKIERFWKTIWEEFLERARFETFEEAVERIGYWVQYNNHRRPHQGIEGLGPADRYGPGAALGPALEPGGRRRVSLPLPPGPGGTSVGRMDRQSVADAL